MVQITKKLLLEKFWIRWDIMKEKMMMNLKNLKELYGNRRYRALFTLGLYAIFFLIVLAIFVSGKSSYNENLDDNKDLTTLDKFRAVNNYEYYYNVEKVVGTDTIYYNIEGKRYLNKEVFTIKNDINGYYIEDNILYVTRDNIKEKTLQRPLSVDFTKLKPFNIVDLIKLASLESTTSNYSDDTIKNSYLLPVKDFVRLYFNERVEDKDNSFVGINTYEKDGNITKIEMDLTNADKYENYIIDFHKLELNYKNISFVKDFTVDGKSTDDPTE